MPRTATKDINWYAQWGEGSNPYMALRIVFRLTATIDDAVTTLQCSIGPAPGYSDVHIETAYGNAGGYGFINLGGFAWSGAHFYKRREDYQDKTAPYYEWWYGDGWGNPPASGAGDVRAEMLSVFPTMYSDTIAAVYSCDDGTGRPQGVIGGSRSRTFDVSNAGNVLEVNLIRWYTRWRDNYNTSTAPTGAVVIESNESHPDFSMTFSDLFPDFYPGARRVSGAWLSCNRGTDRVKQGGAFRRSSSGWVGELNASDSTAVANQRGLRRVSGAWVRSEKI